MDEEINLGNVEVVEDEKLKFGGDSRGILSTKRKKRTSGMAAFVTKLSRGYIETELQANIVLIFIAVVFFVVSFFFYF